jgi:solute carrier family 25 oxoglutarate transporter 11
LSFAQKAGCASFAGFIGSLVGNPADLVLVRMQADKRLPPAERRNYTGAFNAFTTIVKTDGVAGLWRGATPTVIRAVVLNLAMLATYDEAKEQINKLLDAKSDSLAVRAAASAISGISASVASLPLDNAKTKLQKMTKNSDGTLPYKNIFDAMSKVNNNLFRLFQTKVYLSSGWAFQLIFCVLLLT